LVNWKNAGWKIIKKFKKAQNKPVPMFCAFLLIKVKFTRLEHAAIV